MLLPKFIYLFVSLFIYIYASCLLSDLLPYRTRQSRVTILGSVQEAFTCATKGHGLVGNAGGRWTVGLNDLGDFFFFQLWWFCDSMTQCSNTACASQLYKFRVLLKGFMHPSVFLPCQAICLPLSPQYCSFVPFCCRLCASFWTLSSHACSFQPWSPSDEAVPLISLHLGLQELLPLVQGPTVFCFPFCTL